jgi:MFS family permease
MITTGPIIAPLLGGALCQAYGWRSTFMFLAGLNAIIITLCFIKLPETLHWHVSNRMFKNILLDSESNKLEMNSTTNPPATEGSFQTSIEEIKIKEMNYPFKSNQPLNSPSSIIEGGGTIEETEPDEEERMKEYAPITAVDGEILKPIFIPPWKTILLLIDSELWPTYLLNSVSSSLLCYDTIVDSMQFDRLYFNLFVLVPFILFFN